MLYWEKPYCQVFRNVLTHPRLLPYYTTLLGHGYRLDHQPLLIVQGKDSEGFALHGGPREPRSGRFNPELQYRCDGGEPWTSLLAVSVQLCDHKPGDGGFCIVRGSHKLNFPVPDAMANGESDAFREHIHQPVSYPPPHPHHGSADLVVNAPLGGCVVARASTTRTSTGYAGG